MRSQRAVCSEHGETSGAAAASVTQYESTACYAVNVRHEQQCLQQTLHQQRIKHTFIFDPSDSKPEYTDGTSAFSPSSVAFGPTFTESRENNKEGVQRDEFEQSTNFVLAFLKEEELENIAWRTSGREREKTDAEEIHLEPDHGAKGGADEDGVD